MFRKLLPLLLVLMLALAILPASAESAEPVFKTLPIYYYSSTRVNEVPVAFFDGCTDIPYCSVETVVELLNRFALMDEDYQYNLDAGYTTYHNLADAGKLSYTEDQDPEAVVYYIGRENGSFVLFDYDDNYIWINDRDLFSVPSFAVSGGDLVSADGNFYNSDGTVLWNESTDEPAVNLYHHVRTLSFKREGEVVVINLGDYDISIKQYDNSYYLPLATVSDVLMPTPITFNGQALFTCHDNLPDNNRLNDDGLTQHDLYFMPEACERSAELTDFTYNELCLMLDHNYGLMEEHGVYAGFDNYFIDSGLYADLHSTDINVFTDALNKVLSGYFGDRHSGLICASPYSGGLVKVSGDNTSVSIKEGKQLYSRFLNAREAAGITVNNNIINGYTEVGDTAFVTFDSFIGATTNYYNKELWPTFSDIYMSDTISLVVFAHDRIHRANSPIRKVVIDLSCNGGGSLNACVYIAAWVLGEASVSIENAHTGAQYTTKYWVDVNLDGKCSIDDDLGVDKLDVYCLVNGNSFSCGNLLPTLFKQDGRVTLVGQTSGGGACLIRNTSTADGTRFSISDYYRLSIVKNGSFYSIDRGVEADIPLRKPASFYDRTALADYLDTIR